MFTKRLKYDNNCLMEHYKDPGNDKKDKLSNNVTIYIYSTFYLK